MKTSTQHAIRNNKGNMLVLILCLTAVVFIPLLAITFRLAPYLSSRGRAQNVVEAAALLVANDVSRLVENDPHFGFVGFSNHPATGKATRAQDGEALPVLGINTVVGTIRQNAIIAMELHNTTMQSLVDEDLVALDKTSKGLVSILKESLKEQPNLSYCVDADGNFVNPRETVRKFFSDNLPSNIKVESLNMTVGWLEDGSETIIDVPKPQSKSQVHTIDMDNGKYHSFKNIPVGSRSFSFAGLGAQSHLVSSSKFRPDDGQHISTIIKMDCTLTDQEEPDAKILYTVCCQPCSRPDEGARGAMTVRFAQKPVPGLLSWNDFLASGSFSDNRIMNFDIVGGDYPFDPKARMRLSSNPEARPGTAEQFAEHLYFWLRNGRMKPSIEAVLSMMSEPFLTEENQVYTYEFESNGSISRKVNSGEGFTRAVTSDGQVATLADTHMKSGANAVIIFRDNVGDLATNAGKHGGQALAGYPTGNSGSQDYQGMDKEFSKRNDHQTGLAVDIEIGGTGDSTAKHDAQLSMHHRTGTPRRI